jgi:type II secretory pathway predicted ATPase ExeA
MYEKVFQLTSRPFVSTPDVERFYSAQSAHHALSQACSSIERSSGTVLVVGPTGAGKTLFLQMIEEQFASIHKVVNIACARLEKRHDLLQNILFELNQPYLDMSEGELRLAIIDYLKPGSECPNGILLLVDEAHLLETSLLDEVRLLTNFVRDGRPRVQLVLAGNVKLEENLMDNRLESFNQRVATRCYLANFTKSETSAYISSAIIKAGAEENEIFTDCGMEVVHEVTEGCPRLINQVCDHAMILAASAKTKTIDAACVHEAWSDVQHLPNPYAAAAEAITNTPVSESEIEFGSLGEFEDDSDDENINDVADSANSSDEPVGEVPNHTEKVSDSDWTEIEFGQLDETESEVLRALSSYDQADNSLTEVSYELEQQFDDEEMSTGDLTDESSQVDAIDEYKLAPPEVVQTSELSLDDFESVNRLVSSDENIDESSEEYVDVRFKDLAQFLAAGGQVDDKASEETTDVAEDLGLLEQIEIQDELIQTQEQVAEQVVPVEAEVDAELEELIKLKSPEDLKVHYDTESMEAVGETLPQTASDIFGGWFEEEEIVHDPYTARVAEQNHESLNITRTQLAILEDGFVESADLSVDKDESMTAGSLESEEITNQEYDADLADDLALQEALSSGSTAGEMNLQSVDGSELLDTIHKQQAEIADQIFKLKKELVDTGFVDAELELEAGRELESSALEQVDYDDRMDYAASEFDAVEPKPLALETPLESVDNDDRDILVITRVSSETPAEETVDSNLEVDTPVSTGRAIRMDYRELFSQLRAAE